jgi:hypothetical protein
MAVREDSPPRSTERPGREEVRFTAKRREGRKTATRAVAIPALALTAALAACGGGSPKHYRVSEVHSCLVSQHLSMKPADIPGDVAPDGSEGDLAVHVGDSEVGFAFGKDSSEAKRHAREEKAAASVALGADASAYVRTRANVAYWVTDTDTDAFDAVERCLQ